MRGSRTGLLQAEGDGEVEVKAVKPRLGEEALVVVRDWLCCVRAAPDDEATAAAKKLARQPKMRGILRAAHDGRRHKERIKWRTVLVGDENVDEDQRAKAQDELDERDRRLRFEQWTKLARLPALTLEELLIPVRIAFPELTVAPPAAILLDVFIDLFEIGWIVKTMRENPTPEQRKEMLAAQLADPENKEVIKEEYTAAHVARDVGMALSLHIARGIYLITADDTLWTLVQVVRALRVYVLITYVNQINNDLSTNVKFLAVYKFALVMISIPHWVACIWWALATTWGNADLPLPSWPAQFDVLSAHPDFNPLDYGSWHRYLISLYMSWAGLTAMGYGTLVLTLQSEVIYATLVAVIHMVFYAFVLGTLLHYLVRTNESTVHFNELMKAVDTYVSERKLPAELTAKIRAHYAFQHKKSAAGIDRIFSQMPLSMRTEVAVAQYDRQMHGTWVFWNCTPQFLSYLALYLRERHMMPTETLFRRGDGAAELPWCVSGSLQVSKGDTHITTIRSDLGPGQIVGEIAFFVGIQQPYTVVASSKGEVTLIVLSSASFDEIIGSYPEQTDQIMTNLLRKFGLDKRGQDIASGGGFQEQMDEDELKEYEEMRATIRTAIVEHNEELFARMTIAIKQGDVETVRTLIARGFDSSLHSYDARKPLHLAALEGNRTIVRVLCELGASVNDTDRFESTPIKNAIECMHGAVAEELAHFGARLALPRPAESLHRAAKEGDMNSMTMLVAHGTNINCVNFDGRTALHVAAHEGNARVAEYLLSNMADVHASDRWARSPLDDAISEHHPLVAQMLVRNAARPNAAAMAEQLRCAANRGDTDRLRFLLEMGAQVDAQDYDQRGALHCAVRSGSLSAAHLLVCSLADVDMPDRWRRPPLLDALELSKPVASMLALQCGASLPAHCAADEALSAQLAAARRADMYEINRLISAWTRGNKTHNEKKLERSRDVELAFSELADGMGGLLHAKRALFRQLGKYADIWIGEYADEADSDDESDIANEDDLADAGGSDGGESVESEGGARGARESKASADAAAASQFIKLVLQLTSAEAGLVELRRLFRQALPPGARKGMRRAERARAEEECLRGLLTAELGLDGPLAASVLADIYAELAKLLGQAAPRPAEAYGAGGGGFASRARAGVPGAEAAPGGEPEEARAGPELHLPARAAALDVVRRRSGSGANMIDLSKRLGRDSGSRRGSRSRTSSSASAPDDSEPLFLSELGHVVLLCSRSLVQALAERHELARARQRLGGGPISGSHDALPSTPPGPSTPPAEPDGGGRARGGMRGRLLRMNSRGVELVASREPRQPSASSAGTDEAHAAAAAASAKGGVEKAAYVLLKLFEVFDSAGSGSIRLRDVARLQGALGELGSAEIKSLVTYLMSAARAFAATAGGAAGEAAQPFAGRRSSGGGARDMMGALMANDAQADGRPLPAEARKGGARSQGRSTLADFASAVRVDAAAKQAAGAPAAEVAPFPRIVLGDDEPPAREASLEARAPAADAADGGAPAEGARGAGAPAADAPDDNASSSDSEAEQPAADASSSDSEAEAAVARGPGALAAEPSEGTDSALRASAASGARSAFERRQKQSSSLSEVQFFVGVSSWILLSAAETDGPDEHGGQQAQQLQPPAGVPRLTALALTQNGKGMPALNLGGGAAVARPARPHEGAAPAKAPAGPASAERNASLLRELDGALFAVPAYLLLADNLQMRFETGRLKPTDLVEPDALLALIGHSVIVPSGASAATLTRWAAIRLGLDIGGGGGGGEWEGGDGEQNSSRSGAGSDGGDLRKQLLKALATDEGADGARARPASWRDLRVKLSAAAVEMREAGKEGGGAAGGTTRKSLFALCFGGGAASSAAAGDADELDGGDPSERPWYIVSMHDPRVGYFNLLFLTAIWWDTVTIPMQLAFIEQARQFSWLYAVNTITDGIYLLHILLQMHTTYVNDKSAEVFRPTEIRQDYLHGDFVLDLIANFPHDLLAWMFGVDALTVFALRVLRLLNCRYTSGAFGRWKAKLHEADFGGGLVKFLTPLLITMHVNACIWQVIGFSAAGHVVSTVTWADAYRAQQEDIWPDAAELEYGSPEAQMLDQYIISFNSVVAMVSAIGMDEQPNSFVEFGFFIFAAIINTTVYAWCVGGISGLVMKQDDEIVLKRAQLELVHTYVRHIHVPQELKDRMTGFFQQRLQHASLSTVDSDQIYTGLPMPLQMEVAAHTNRALVGAAALLRGCSTGFLDRLSSALFEREMDAETSVFRSGEACKELMLIATGSIEMREDKVADTQGASEVLGAGDILGDIPFVFGIRHYQNARVGRTKSSIFVLSTDAYRELLKAFPAQEDIIMDNAMNKHEGMATSRSAKSKASGASGSRAGSSDASRHKGGARSDAGKSAVSMAGGGEQDLHKVLAEAKRRRDELMHAQLCTACAKGDFEKARRMLTSRSIDVDHGDFAGRRAIHLAACGGDLRVLELLIAGRADVNIEDERGVTPLTEALQADRMDAAELLVKHGGRHGSRDVSEQVCSIAASPSGGADLKRLCLYGGNVNACTHEGRTPLHVAAAEGCAANAEALIESGADLNARDRHGSTPLQDAVVGKQDELCAILLGRGARLGAFNEAEQLNVAAANDDLVHLRRLLRFSCSVNAQDGLGRSPLHLAASCRRVNVLSLLLDTPGVDVHIEDQFGNTAYDDALREESKEQQVILALLASRHAVPGSHVGRRAALSALQVETEREAGARALIESRDSTLLQAKALSMWVAAERNAVKAFQSQVHKALRLEREQGAVLADVHPEFWGHIYAYFEGHLDWRHEAATAVQPMIDKWREETRDFALATIQRLAAKFSDLCAMSDSEARPAERLYEVTFRRPVKVDAS